MYMCHTFPFRGITINALNGETQCHSFCLVTGAKKMKILSPRIKIDSQHITLTRSLCASAPRQCSEKRLGTLYYTILRFFSLEYPLLAMCGIHRAAFKYLFAFSAFVVCTYYYYTFK